MKDQAVRQADPCVFVIFGAGGDLTRRKLAPALYNLARHGFLGPRMRILGFARNELTAEQFRADLTEAVREFGGGQFEADVWERLAAGIDYIPGDFGDRAAYRKLKEKLEVEGQECAGNTLFYLATPPSFFGEIAAQIGRAGLQRREDDQTGWTRVIVEKPFGRDLESARELNRQLVAVFNEEQIYRIDHYLGKETVQNILLFRFANGIFEPVWNRRYVDHVQIMVAESIGVEGRGNYYEEAGALRDMVQNHMFQLMTLVAMEPPISMDAEEVRDEKVRVLRAVAGMRDEEILHCAVRGQHGPGVADGKPVPGYRQEPRVAPDSPVETYVALKLCIQNWRWAGVPFYLRTGKRLARRDTEIVIQFRQAPLNLVRLPPGEQLAPNRLTIHIQPDERITLRFEAKLPGPSVRLTPVEMQFRYSDLAEGSPNTGYETLLYDCMVGDSTLFHRADMVEAAWTIATPILNVWKALTPRDFPNYAAGTWGPAAADELIRADGREWIEPE